MPPKRAKNASSATKTAQPTPLPTTNTRSTRSRRAQEDERIENFTDSDDSTGLVRTRAKKRPSLFNEDELVMTGGLGEGDVRYAHRIRAKAALEQEKEAENAPEDTAQEEEDVAEKTALKPAPRPRGGRQAKKPVQNQEAKQKLEALRLRMEDDKRRLKEGTTAAAPVEQQERAVELSHAVQDAPSAAEAQDVVTDAARRSPSPALQRDAPSTIQRKAPASVTRPQSTLKVQSTPGAENSVLALKNFRHRPRQHSLLQMVQNPDIGNDTTDFTLGSDEGDSFAPEDESTPLQLSKAALPQALEQNKEGDDAEHEPFVAEGADDADDLYDATPLPSPKRSRKRKSGDLEDESEIQVIRSSPPRSQHSLSQTSLPSDPADFLPIPATAPSATSTGDPLSSPPRSPISSTMADPLSSSPPPTAHTMHAVPRPSRSPQALRKTNAKPPKPLTTAALRAMLPKRHTQRRAAADRSAFDIPTSSSANNTSSSPPGNDSDEPAYNARTRQKKPTKQPRPNTKKPAPTQKTGGPARKPGTLSPVTGRKRQKSSEQQPKRTYARAGEMTSDKENEAESESLVKRPANILAFDPDTDSPLSSLESLSEGDSATAADTSLETVGARGGKAGGKSSRSEELEAARRKFAEVDRWEMEFESASLGGGGDSSPWR